MFSIAAIADLPLDGWREDFAELADRFENLGVIGKGAYGYPRLTRCVYKARKLAKQSEVLALKKIQPLKEKDGVGPAEPVPRDSASRNQDPAVAEPREHHQAALHHQLERYATVTQPRRSTVCGLRRFSCWSTWNTTSSRSSKTSPSP